MLNNNILKELYPGAEDITYEPMLIHSSTDAQLKKACESGEYFGQLKKDGAFYQYIKGLNGKSYLFGRTISKKTGVLTEKSANVPHIMSTLDCLPNGTILIGEVYYPGKTSKDVVSIMGCLPEKAIERQNGSYGKIHYYIHDILMYDGVNLVSSKTNNELRYKILKKIFYINNLEEDWYIELAKVWYDNLYERVGNALSAGEEGMVIKKKDGIYEPSKRPMTNLKAKKVDFADVVIIGFEEPTKEYYGKEEASWPYCIVYQDIDFPNGKYIEYERSNEGWIAYRSPQYKTVRVTKPYYMGWRNSRIKIGAYDENGDLFNIGTIHSGISDNMKQDMSEHPENYLGKVCSIQCMELDKTEHTIRHGFWRNMREDKDPKDCTISSIF